ncbi:MAG: FtsX-like permease family protein [Longimicrobiales bacterium]
MRLPALLDASWEARRSLSRDPLRRPARTLLVLGAGTATAVLGLFTVRGGLPPDLLARLTVRPVTAVELGFAWKPDALSPAALEQAGLDALLRIMLALGFCALAAACLAVAVMLIGHARAKREEIGLRLALGATRRSVQAQLLVESVLLASPALAAGLLLGVAGRELLTHAWPHDAGAGVGWALAAFALGCSVVPLLALGLLPARVDARRPLRSGAASATDGNGRPVTGRGLAALQIALTLMLLTGGGLLLRARAPDGSEPEPGRVDRAVVAAALVAPAAGGELARQHGALADALRQAFGVGRSALASPGAWNGLGTQDRVRAMCGGCPWGGLSVPMIQGSAVHHAISPGYFDTLSIRVIRGRAIERGDVAAAPPVAVINRTAENALFRTVEPLGKPIQIGGFDGRWYTVVGVVDDTPVIGLGASQQPRPAVYLSLQQHPPPAVEAFATGDAASAATLAEIGFAAGYAVRSAAPLVEWTRFRAAPARWAAAVLLLLAALTLGIAAYGVRAAAAFFVQAARREIGVQRALGARRRDIVTMVLGWAGAASVRGVAAGAFGALAVGRYLQLHVSGVQLFDAPLFLVIAAVLTVATLLGALGPALAAARLDPAAALRVE